MKNKLLIIAIGCISIEAFGQLPLESRVHLTEDGTYKVLLSESAQKEFYGEGFLSVFTQ
jgi:hypothetical protein